MPFFDPVELRAIIEREQISRKRTGLRKIKILYCGNCQAEHDHVFLGWRDVPKQFVGVRICIECGFSPGLNQGVQDKDLRQAVLDADNHECVYCGSTEHLAVDHIVPHVRGGEKIFDNLLTACQSCNSSRRTGRTHVLRFGRFRK